MTEKGRSTELSRRRFIAGAAAATAGLFGVELRPSARRRATADPASVEHGAAVTQSAARGGMKMITPPPDPGWRPGDFIDRIEPFGGQRVMALTFDDGPSPANTYTLLRALAARDVKATFFVIGVNVRSFPQIARDIVSEGHEIANHSVYHWPYRASALAGQIGGNQAIIRDATGVTPTAHRAPGLTRGSSILDQCRVHGVYEVHTHMSMYDWMSPRFSASTLFQQFVRDHRNGAFALYHDGGGRRPTPDAIPSIIDYAVGIGYEFLTCLEMFGRGTAMPLDRRYPSHGRSSARVRADAGAPEPDDQVHVHDSDEWTSPCCAYDARGELTKLANGEGASITAAERSRIVEILAEYDELERDS